MLGGVSEPAPPVHMFRLDGVPFTTTDFDVLDDFEMRMLDDGPRPVARSDWELFAMHYSPCHGGFGPLLLEHRHPRSQVVRACGLKATELNGQQGEVAGGAHYTNHRVGVQFGGDIGLKAIKPDNLVVVPDV